MTQEDEETLAVQRQRDKEEKARKEAEAERLRQEKAKAAQAEAARIAKEKALAEQKAKEQAAKDKAAAMGSLFGNNAAGAQGTGDSKGEGQKGNPVAGYGTSGGNSWSLAGVLSKVPCQNRKMTLIRTEKWSSPFGYWRTAL